MRIRPKNKIDASFSMVSMTDIIFLLLIFLLIATNHTHNAIPVDLPLSSNGKAPSAPINITVTGSLQYYIEGKQVPFAQLQLTLREKLSQVSNKVVVLHMDKHLSIDHMVKIADIANGLGASIALATECNKTL